jgi:flagella basal body P-ring formation protein FlgA
LVLLKKILFLFLVLSFGWSFAGSSRADNFSSVKEVIKSYVVAKYPQWDKADVEVSIIKTGQGARELTGLTAKASFRVLDNYAGFKPLGRVVFPLEVKSANGTKKINLAARVEVFRPVVVAVKAIRKGSALQAADLRLERRDVAMLPQSYFMEQYSLDGKEAKTSIPANATILSWMVGAPPLFHKGEKLELLVSAPGMMIKARGEALEDGYLGGMVKVRRLGERKIISGKVIGSGRVEVKI